MFDIAPLQWTTIILVQILITLTTNFVAARCMRWLRAYKERKVRKRVAEYDRIKNELADTERKIRQLETQFGSDHTVVRLHLLKRNAVLSTLHDYIRRYGKYLNAPEPRIPLKREMTDV